MKRKNRKKKKHILLKLVGFVIFVVVVIAVANSISTFMIFKNIETYSPVDYSGEDRVLPTLDDKTGYYTFVTDKDVEVMVMNDLHIGGGFWSHKKDIKTIYEVVSMLQQEKPDLVILNGDSIFAVPGPVFNGGGTFNNKMAASIVTKLFENEEVYFTIAFGNHDTEAFDFYGRQTMAEFYMDDKFEYCIFNQDYADLEAKKASATNQIILVKNTDGKIAKALLVMDSNDYVDNSIMASINWQYDVIHDAQVDWAKNAIQKLQADYNDFKVISFFHIPIGEFEVAYSELDANNFNDTANAKYVSGVWDELVDEDMGGRIWYGGCSLDEEPENVDSFFEVLGPDGINALEAIYCGHDHVNNGVVKYRGVLLGYNYSLDNLAYDDIDTYGIQRGCMVITIDKNGNWNEVHKNAYKDYDIDANKFVEVNTTDYYYDGVAPKK